MELLEQHLLIWMTHGWRFVLWWNVRRGAGRQQRALSSLSHHMGDDSQPLVPGHELFSHPAAKQPQQ